ncbi:hypothetical protein MMC09_005776 [Bachmanniomyces sp. S44760]|nr:hypothetical protein [Bachmanniomyces sp. S44760]
MAAVASQSAMAAVAPTSSRSSSMVNGNAANSYKNVGSGSLDSPASSVPQAPPTAPIAKKGKGKKAVDPNETSKLLAAKINQLENDAAGEKDQEIEIEREVRKATRDLNNLLAGMGTPLERMDALQKRNTELFADMKRLERDHAKNKKRAELLQKERDSGRSELSKTLSQKEKLEKLSRELSRENKKMKDDLKKLEGTEMKHRDNMSHRFQGILGDLDEVMENGDNPANQKLNMETDELFRHKFKSFFDHCELRESHFTSLINTKEREKQVAEIRMEQHRKHADTETARARNLSVQVSTFSQTEIELRNQLNIYVEKFKQVEDTLNNSNDLFMTFRKEMEEMSKKTKRLEKENLNLTRKHDLTNRNILEMAEDRTRMNKEIETLRRRNNTLESVIRRMQDQGRGPADDNALEGDEEGTDSDYEEDDYDDEEGSEEGEYDDDTEEDIALQANADGSVEPVDQMPVNGTTNGEQNGIGH